MNLYADRDFVDWSNLDLIDHFKKVGKYISTKPMFGALKLLGDELLAQTVIYEEKNTAVSDKDLREKDNRDNARKAGTKIALKICDEVNLMANNDPAIYSEAGLAYKEKANPARPFGKTEILEVTFNSLTRRIEIRVKKADKATNYQVDLKDPDGKVTEDYNTLPNTKGTIPAPLKAGGYQIRVIPRDSKGNKGEPTEWSAMIPVA